MSNNIFTKVTELGRSPFSHEGFVNPPIQRGSTVLFDDAKNLYADVKSYGLEGASTQDRLCDALTQIMGGIGTVLCPSGLSAITTTLFSVVKSGDHLLITDSVYGPTRRFCDNFLKNLGIETTYYDPRIGEGIKELIQANTKLIFMESPGSLTLEVQDVPAIVKIAKENNIFTVIDDTWSAGVYFKPLTIGVDISIQALTKYQGGHADILAGSITTSSENLLKKLKQTHLQLGIGTSAEDAWLCLRGLKTMMVRLQYQDNSAREIASWLEAQDEVLEVIHPALNSSQDHEIWSRDFSGAGGLFSIILKPCSDEAVYKMLNSYKHFSMGFSWGGFESLVINCDPQIKRTATKWEAKGPLIRYSIGLEATSDLIEDLKNGFMALKA